MNLNKLIHSSSEEPTVLIYQTGIKSPSQSLASQITATDIVDPGRVSRENTKATANLHADFSNVLKHYNWGILHAANLIKEYQSVFEELCSRCDRVVVFKYDLWGKTLGRIPEEVFGNTAVFYNLLEKFSANNLGLVDDSSILDGARKGLVKKLRKRAKVEVEQEEVDKTTTSEFDGVHGESNDPF